MYLTEKSRWKEVLSVTFVSRTCLSALYGLFCPESPVYRDFVDVSVVFSP